MTEREQFLSDIITTALEGGIGYWSVADHYQWVDDAGVHVCVRGMHDSDCVRYGALAVVRVLRDDDEGYEDEQRWITTATIAEGIQRLLDGTVSYPVWAQDELVAAVHDNDAGMIDSDDADNIVQAALLGEIVYG